MNTLQTPRRDVLRNRIAALLSKRPPLTDGDNTLLEALRRQLASVEKQPKRKSTY